MKKTTFVLAFITLFSLGTVAMVNYRPDLKQRIKETYDSLVEDEIHTEYVDLPSAESLQPSTEIELPSFTGRLKKDSYEEHLSTATLMGIGLIEDEEQLQKLVASGALVEASSGAGYQVSDLTHSHPYFSLHTKNILEEIGQTFETMNGRGNYMMVTSATRTMAQQKKLSRRNRNATKGESSHSYGVSFDISYVRFNGEKNYDRQAQKDLEAVLKHFQKENKIFVIKERRQACYHVTVR